MRLVRRYRLATLLFGVVPLCACISLVLAVGLRWAGILRPPPPPFGNVFARHAHGIYAMPSWDHGYPKFDRIGNAAFYDDQRNNIALVPVNVRRQNDVLLLYSHNETYLKLDNCELEIRLASSDDTDLLIVVTDTLECKRFRLVPGAAADFHRATPYRGGGSITLDIVSVIRNYLTKESRSDFDQMIIDQLSAAPTTRSPR